MKGLSIFELLAGLDEDMIAAATLPETSAAAVKPPRRRWRKGAIGDFLNNGWVAACASAVIALAVLVAIITAGQNGEKGDGRENHTLPPVPGTEESVSEADETTDVVESESERESEGESESESETAGMTGTETSVGTEIETETKVSFSDELEFTMKDDGTYEVSGIGPQLGTELVIPAEHHGVAVTSIGENSLKGTGLTSVTIPDSVTSIGKFAFVGCSNLTSIHIPEGIKTIEQGVFGGCSGLTSITIPNGVTHIGYNAFGSCTGLTSITIPDSVVSIDRFAFQDCGNLRSVSLGNGVESLGESAFSGCASLTSITIPASVTKIGSGTFSGPITNFQVDTESQHFVVEDGILYSRDMTELIRCPVNKTTVTIPESALTSQSITMLCSI